MPRSKTLNNNDRLNTTEIWTKIPAEEKKLGAYFAVFLLLFLALDKALSGMFLGFAMAKYLFYDKRKQDEVVHRFLDRPHAELVMYPDEFPNIGGREALKIAELNPGL